jgi:hypothetical protein
MHQTTPTGELQRALRKSAHLSNKKRKKRSKKAEKRLGKIKSFFRSDADHTLFEPGNVLSFVLINLKEMYVGDKVNFSGVVIDRKGGKKKWNRSYSILTGHGLIEMTHEYIEKNFIVRKYED